MNGVLLSTHIARVAGRAACRALETTLAAAAAAALLVGAGVASAQAQTPDARLDAMLEPLLADPDDLELNLAYARAAEDAGRLRHALAAYERAARANPDSAAARRGFARIRRLLSPTSTRFRLEVGGSGATVDQSDMLGFDDFDEAVGDARLSMVDERTVGGVRLRSELEAAGVLRSGDAREDQARLRGWSGPVATLGADVDLHLAAGASVRWRDEAFRSVGVGARARLSTLFQGREQLFVVAIERREIHEDGVDFEDGWIASARASLTTGGLAFVGDQLFLTPSVRWSRPDDDGAGPPDQASDDVLGFAEYGARIAYFAPAFDGRVVFGVGAEAYDRFYERNRRDADERRRDLRTAATAHVVFPDVFLQTVDLRLDYRFESDFSNDNVEDRSEHVGGGRIIWRF